MMSPEGMTRVDNQDTADTSSTLWPARISETSGPPRRGPLLLSTVRYSHSHRRPPERRWQLRDGNTTVLISG